MKKPKLRTVAVIEGVVLTAVAVMCRLFIFRLFNGEAMLHVRISMHCFMIGAMLTLFCALALTVKRAWKTHGTLIILPAIFLVFGFVLQVMAYDIDF